MGRQSLPTNLTPIERYILPAKIEIFKAKLDEIISGSKKDIEIVIELSETDLSIETLKAQRTEEIYAKLYNMYAVVNDAKCFERNFEKSSFISTLSSRTIAEIDFFGFIVDEVSKIKTPSSKRILFSEENFKNRKTVKDFYLPVFKIIDEEDFY